MQNEGRVYEHKTIWIEGDSHDSTHALTNQRFIRTSDWMPYPESRSYADISDGLHFHWMERRGFAFCERPGPCHCLPSWNYKRWPHSLITCMSFLIPKNPSEWASAFRKAVQALGRMGSGSASSRVRCVCWSSATSKPARPKRIIPMRAMSYQFAFEEG